MSFIDEVLQQPSYGWKDENGELIKPTLKQLYKEAFSRINFFANRKNWISAVNWVVTILMLPFFYFFIFHYFTIPRLILFIVYAMIVMGTHGTVWFHRYCTHKAYTFSKPIWRIMTQNLVIKTFPEEMYVVSHHVHHVKSDEPGDPYNAKAGFMYCMLADVNHQGISKNMSEQTYNKAAHFMRHTGVSINSYKQYQKWGSIATPLYTIGILIINWIVWFTILYFIGGFGLVCTLFTAAMFWSVLVKAFNYTGHAKGEVKHIDGIDFDRRNLSINQNRPGWFAGEWHNNHHLYPVSARAGFLPYQIDLAWIYIFSMYKIGVVSSYHDSKKEFMRKYAERHAATVHEQLSPVTK